MALNDLILGAIVAILGLLVAFIGLSEWGHPEKKIILKFSAEV